MTMLVSVYVPTRNRVTLLKRAVESVLNQSHPDIQLIVVNDASSDGTEEYLRRVALSDSRLMHISNAEPKGAPASRNTAILKSSGYFVTGLDDDDEFLSNRIEVFIDSWQAYAAQGVKPSCLYSQDARLRSDGQYLVTQKRQHVTFEDLFESNYIGNQIFAPRHHFVEAGLFNEGMPAWQDLEFFIRLLQKFGPAFLSDKVTYKYDATMRSDRISAQEKRIRAAFDAIVRIHSVSNVPQQRALFLQVFQRGYGISPSVKDWIHFLGLGGQPKGILRLLRATASSCYRRWTS